MTADKQLKAYIDRVLRLKEEQDTIGDDIREIYAEAKAEGYDKTIMGKLVAHLRRELKQGAGAVAEAESIFDTYLHAYQRASGTPVAIAHTHEEKFDAETGEILEDINPRLVKQVVDGMQTEAGRAALIAAVDILIEQEEAEEENSPETATTQRVNGHSQHEGANAQATVRSEVVTVVGTESGTVSHSEIDPNEDREQGHSLGGVNPDGETRSPDANAGGGHVNSQSEAAQRAGALVKPAPAHKPLRPHCQNPGEHCGGYGSHHCSPCLRAAKETEVAA